MEFEQKMAKINEDKILFNSQKDRELKDFEEWKKEETAKITKARRKSDKNVIDLNCTVKKLKEDNDALRVEINKMALEHKDKEIKFKAQIDRSKKSIETLSSKNAELEKGMQMLRSGEVAQDMPLRRPNEVNRLIRNPDFNNVVENNLNVKGNVKGNGKEMAKEVAK
eukprot:CAMPEP_0116891084 /NCGR_PEP_ID=MMETSP0467-20121206/1560_1 /TAXON_ID=283647 /ORGANISM="Mesodinium pulex, Strain SPMC105" /LENGTH=166 /DNA_ID=CAMNT_0004559365 /DNA_START=407 /DNA_END=908 /DNA_ORIENTATION=-